MIQMLMWECMVIEMLDVDVGRDELGKTLLNEHMLMFVLFSDERWMECDSVKVFVHLGWETLVERSVA